MLSLSGNQAAIPEPLDDTVSLDRGECAVGRMWKTVRFLPSHHSHALRDGGSNLYGLSMLRAVSVVRE
jgi:hypothetical protein